MPPAGLAFDSLARGDVLPAVDLTITADDVRAYLDATGERADRWDDRVPPVMMSALMLATLLAQVEIPQGIMHTGHEHESKRPVRVAEPLRVTVRVSAHAVRPLGLVITYRAHDDHSASASTSRRFRLHLRCGSASEREVRSHVFCLFLI